MARKSVLLENVGMNLTLLDREVMVDLRTILEDHRSKRQKPSEDLSVDRKAQTAQLSEIPDLFFDDILVTYKLSRVEIMVLMYLYRRVWCHANLYKEYGISQILSHTEMAKALSSPIESIYQSLRKIEEFGFITTIRSGQYFVRKYFTREYDEQFGQTYDDFEI